MLRPPEMPAFVSSLETYARAACETAQQSVWPPPSLSSLDYCMNDDQTEAAAASHRSEAVSLLSHESENARLSDRSMVTSEFQQNESLEAVLVPNSQPSSNLEREAGISNNFLKVVVASPRSDGSSTAVVHAVNTEDIDADVIHAEQAFLSAKTPVSDVLDLDFEMARRCLAEVPESLFPRPDSSAAWPSFESMQAAACCQAAQVHADTCTARQSDGPADAEAKSSSMLEAMLSPRASWRIGSEHLSTTCMQRAEALGISALEYCWACLVALSQHRQQLPLCTAYFDRSESTISLTCPRTIASFVRRVLFQHAGVSNPQCPLV
ncbi:hypothetical protein CAOG_04550 [Capsaspora owczarzaki ATCC 30864]|uniref:Uncharacterized protein n=1 Tax=Capsaspora owczarzaki (strain ATCC 30864) TaxID=595528 RepID=A0A0D2VS21_CAPO3|nr:hypothetical protein CAOG_04550 [Capsaspora owczarzaki ATCC 30864]KJE93807.1 hypothetical protein CAOG_004550 [Capsaspora owczarzaki ATCC 30864]|eukprot:XP_004347297.1 hypothetical protein CAOG_04550 [Capsaspora owczarzaki ATCC 30864]